MLTMPSISQVYTPRTELGAAAGAAEKKVFGATSRITTLAMLLGALALPESKAADKYTAQNEVKASGQYAQTRTPRKPYKLLDLLEQKKNYDSKVSALGIGDRELTDDEFKAALSRLSLRKQDGSVIATPDLSGGLEAKDGQIIYLKLGLKPTDDIAPHPHANVIAFIISALRGGQKESIDEIKKLLPVKDEAGNSIKIEKYERTRKMYADLVQVMALATGIEMTVDVQRAKAALEQLRPTLRQAGIIQDAQGKWQSQKDLPNDFYFKNLSVYQWVTRSLNELTECIAYEQKRQR